MKLKIHITINAHNKKCDLFVLFFILLFFNCYFLFIMIEYYYYRIIINKNRTF